MRLSQPQRRLRVCLLALPETTSFAFYGLHEVFSSIGTTWSVVTGEGQARPSVELVVAAVKREAFTGHGGVPIRPDKALYDLDAVDLVIVTDLALSPQEDPRGRWPEAAAWLRRCHEGGVVVCSVCSGAILLAEAGLLDGRAATTHWGFAGLFRRFYPKVRLRADRVLLAADEEQRLITAGGASSFEELALHLVARFFGSTEAVRIAKLFLFGDRSDGQLAFASLRPRLTSSDADIARVQRWLADHYMLKNPVAGMIAHAGLPERSFTRRFRAATGLAPLDYVQTLRVEEAKQLLETTEMATDDVAAAVGYEDPASFRRLFKRLTAITPASYRRRFQPLARLPAGATEPGPAPSPW